MGGWDEGRSAAVRAESSSVADRIRCFIGDKVRVEALAPRNNRHGFSTLWIAGTAASSGFAAALFLAAAGATLGIGFRDTRVDYGYECIVFVLAACCLRKSMPLIPGLLLALIAVWGFC